MSTRYIFVIGMAAALIGGALLTVGSTSWPVAWIGLELNLLGFVPLTIIQMENKKPAIHYFVVQSAGSLLLLFGGISAGVALGLGLIGLLLKMGLAPLHF